MAEEPRKSDDPGKWMRDMARKDADAERPGLGGECEGPGRSTVESGAAAQRTRSAREDTQVFVRFAPRPGDRKTPGRVTFNAATPV